MAEKIPVTIVSGFLGAGKTTLINKVLKEKHDQHIAVIINEFGEVGVDHQFVLDVEEEIYQMDNGCLCCTLRTDIADMLRSILTVKEKNGVKVDRILFETTGIADPSPIAQTFINVPFLNEHFIIDAVLTVVDSKNFLFQTAHQDEPAKQVGFADKIFMSKHSLVTDNIYRKVIEEVRSINAFAEIQDLDEKPVTLDDMFDLQLFYATEKKIRAMEQVAKEEEEEQQHHHHHHDEHECCHHHEDDEECHCHDHDDCDHDHDHDHECCHHHHHKKHHSGINSFVIEADKPLVLANINEWLNELVYMYGQELYRYKGLLYVEGLDYQIIFQGVQMSFDISRGRNWSEDEEHKSTLVFIGKNLPEAELRQSFIECTEK